MVHLHSVKTRVTWRRVVIEGSEGYVCARKDDALLDTRTQKKGKKKDKKRRGHRTRARLAGRAKWKRAGGE